MAEDHPADAWQAPILAGLSSATSLIEDHFVTIGNHLDAALERLERQTTTFETLACELDGPAAGAAMSGLSDAIAQIAGNTQDHARTSDALAALTDAIGQLQKHVPPLASHVRELTILAMYTRLEGNRLGPEEHEFAAFTERMGRSVETARDNLGEFEQEIKNVGALVVAALHDREAFAGSRLTALDHVAGRLAENLDAMRRHREQVASCSAQVAEQSRQMQQRVGQAVAALQVGDSTRQRLEHVHTAVAMMGMLTGPSSDLPADARDDLLGTGAALSTELAMGAVTEFDRDVGDVISVFHGLAADAKALLELGRVVSGRAPGDGDASYLAAIRSDMQGIQEALAAMQAARSASQRMVRTIASSASLLGERIGLVQELEGEMMHMELNAALKCQRLGALGASVRVITGELRGCGQRTAQEAAGAIVVLQRLTTTVQGLAVDEATDALKRPDQLVAQALETLADVERQSNAALSLLQQDGEEVIRLLEQSAEGVVVNRDVIQLVDDAMSCFPPRSPLGDTRRPETSAMLESIARVYTMASERSVHARIAGLEDAPAPELAAADDFLL